MRRSICFVLRWASVGLWFWATLCFGRGDPAFPLSFVLIALCLALIIMLMRRVARALLYVLLTLALLFVLYAIVTDEPTRESVRRFVEEALYIDCARVFVWACVCTFAYGVLCLARPVPQSNISD
jgi:hypothetical protein